MTYPLFVLPGQRVDDDTVVLSGREGHHAADVRRLRRGERVDVTDGAGRRLGCRVVSAARGEVRLEVVSRTSEPAHEPRVEVAQALIKPDAAERALATMTEVGVDAVLPWSAGRSVVTWDDDRVERGLRRWRAAVTEAAKQARRAWVPAVSTPVSTDELVDRVRRVDLALLLDLDAERSLASVEVTGGSVLIVVGPEGGLTEQEATALTGAGALPVHLGPTVLRSATAATVAAAVLLSRTPRWRPRAQEAPAG